VATDIAGCRKVVQDGENGCLCRSRTPRLAQAILRLIRIRAATPHGRAAEIAERDFTTRQHIAEYFSIYGLEAPALAT
jgi:glycosyltransferase involved in cell wall biosynthesis